jgi:N-acyl-D-amino-acid deacylase
VNITGVAQPDLAVFDSMMTGFVQDNKVPGAALAVSRNSQIVYARGFGWADVESKEPVLPDTLFRIASISKPITAVAVLQLAAAGKFQLRDKLFEILSPREWLPMPHDPRLLEITVLQLLQHTGGWDREVSFDPIIKPDEIAKALNKPLPMGPVDVMRYAFTLKLDHDPGQKYAYSNVGYLMLGRLIEHASGKSYEAYVKDEVLKPLGITRMQLGRAWKDELAPGETHYYDRHGRMEPAVNGPQIGVEVPIVYGGQNVEGFEAHGGWIASAIDLVKFASAFDDPAISKLLPPAWVETMWSRPDAPVGKYGRERALTRSQRFTTERSQARQHCWCVGLMA